MHWNPKEGYLEEELTTLLLHCSSVEVPQSRPSLCNLSMMHRDVFEPILHVDLILPSSLQRLRGHKEDSQHLAIHKHTPEIQQYRSSQKLFVSVTAFCCAHRTAQMLLDLFFSHAIPFQELPKLLLQVASSLSSSSPFSSHWEHLSISYCPRSTLPLREVTRHRLSGTRI